MLEELKQQVYEANMELPRRSLVTYTWGNVSGIDREKGLFVIKPSGVEYDELTPDMLVVMDLNGNQVEGDLNPSSDTKTHLELYKAFPALGGVVPVENRDEFARARDLPRVADYRRVPRLVAVKLRLERTVGLHRKQPLGESLPPVVVVPAGIYHIPVLRDGRIRGAHLVEPDPAHKGAVGTHDVEVADFRHPAVGRLLAARGVEHDFARWQIFGLDVGALAGSNLPDFPRGEIHLVNMVVVGGVLFPREQDFLSVVGHVGVAYRAVGVGQQNFARDIAALRNR